MARPPALDIHERAVALYASQWYVELPKHEPLSSFCQDADNFEVINNDWQCNPQTVQHGDTALVNGFPCNAIPKFLNIYLRENRI
jgi:hypothetical protein